jgi:hypothetical protein
MSKETNQWDKLQYPDCFISDEQRMIQQTVSDFVNKEIMPVRHLIDDDHTHEEVVEPILKKFIARRLWDHSSLCGHRLGPRTCNNGVSYAFPARGKNLGKSSA